jgi:hypothetical protein
VLGNATIGKQTGSTPSFEFPAHGHNIQNTTVYINRGTETWRLCRYPPCSACPKSPEAFIFHVDCFKLAKQNFRTPALYIWLIGLWSRPVARLCYPPRAPLIFPTLAAHTHPDIVMLLKSLPLELCQIIASYCPESPVWRYLVALTWPPKTFLRLKESEPVTLSLSDLSNWTRGTILPSSDRLTVAERRFVRMSLDNNGIRKVEFLSSWPEGSSTWSPVRGRWYIIEGFDQLAELQYQSRVMDMSSSNHCFR